MKEYQLDVFLHRQVEKELVGKLVQQGHQIYFEYDSHFIKTGIELSPFKLPLKPGLQIDKERVFSGLPGLFNDSLPDGWGLLLMDRYFRKLDIDFISISPLERLAYLGDRALGALSYEPNYTIDYAWDSRLNLENLAADCEKILHGQEDDILPELIIAGGSPAGARPKVLIAYDEKTQEIQTGFQPISKNIKYYLVKFSTMIDINDIAEVEYAYSLMAKGCDITMPDTRLFSAGRHGAAFGIERFDFSQGQRIHMHTLSGLLHADYRIPNLDYIDYLKVTWLLTQDVKEVYQAFRRMVFNVLTHNRDDHSKNFSFLLKDNKWQLSPAYDLTFSAGIAGEHTMTVAGEGANPKREHLLKVAEKLDLETEKMNGIIDHVQDTVAQWEKYAEEAGVKKTTHKKYKKIFDNLIV